MAIADKYKLIILKIVSIILSIIILKYLSPLFLVENIAIDIKVITLLLTAYGLSVLIGKFLVFIKWWLLIKHPVFIGCFVINI